MLTRMGTWNRVWAKNKAGEGCERFGAGSKMASSSRGFGASSLARPPQRNDRQFGLSRPISTHRIRQRCPVRLRNEARNRHEYWWMNEY
jgi:hypothetical protein